MNFKRITKNILNNSTGYALIEQIVSIVIIGILATSMVAFLSSTSLTFNQIKTRKALIADNSTGLEMLSEELCSMYRIISTDSKMIQFTSTSDTNLVIYYQLENDGLLTRKIGDGSFQPIAQNIDYENSLFTYYDENGNIGTPVRRIRLYLLSNLNNISSPLTLDVSPYTFR